jgi:hypothetical protein
MMDMAPGFPAHEWPKLDLNDPLSPDWQTAIKVLVGRIKERFIDPIDYLIESEESKPAKERHFGFTVLAIDCLLVETLGAFLEGLTDTDGKSKATFSSFLTRRMPNDFSSDLAKKVFTDFRCGILHIGEIGGGGKVWSVGSMIWENNGALTINRTAFHSRLKSEFEKYCVELADPTNIMLRQHFRNKMDFISKG